MLQEQWVDFLSTGEDRLPSHQEMSSLGLAYLGDAVWEVIVRRHLLSLGESRPHRMHKLAVKYVRAGTQAQLVQLFESLWSDEERQVFRRARNAKQGHAPKNADPAEYRHSSGFEAIIGYLYLTGQYQRLQEVARLCISQVERMIEDESK